MKYPRTDLTLPLLALHMMFVDKLWQETLNRTRYNCHASTSGYRHGRLLLDMATHTMMAKLNACPMPRNLVC